MKGFSILYVCNEDRATTRQRLLALKELGIDTDVVFTSRLDEKVSFFRRLARAVQFRAGFFPERNNENRQVLEKLLNKPYYILFVEKGLSIKPSTLVKARELQPAIKIISYTLDDVMNKHNSSRYYLKSLPLYDLHFTNKIYNVDELKASGARAVHYFRNAYSAHVHRPVLITENDREVYGCGVGFIGTYEKQRVQALRYLADNGITIKIWGWGRTAEKSGMIHPNIIMTDKYVYDDEYAKVVCATKINLCFLRKINRDTETTRSIEIPACGGFMLAERTPEHQSLLVEDEEAVYFDNNDELLKKVQFYLQHDAERQAIAEKGMQRCRNSGYSYHHQLSTIINLTLGYEAIGHSNHASHSI